MKTCTFLDVSASLSIEKTFASFVFLNNLYKFKGVKGWTL